MSNARLQRSSLQPGPSSERPDHEEVRARDIVGGFNRLCIPISSSASSEPIGRTGSGCRISTEHPTCEDKVCCCYVLDVYSRRVVVLVIADHICSEFGQVIFEYIEG